MPKNRKILLLERPESGPAFADLLNEAGFQVTCISTVGQATEIFDEMLVRGEEPWLVITGALVNVNAGDPACLPFIEHVVRANFSGHIVGMSSIPEFRELMRAVEPATCSRTSSSWSSSCATSGRRRTSCTSSRPNRHQARSLRNIPLPNRGRASNFLEEVLYWKA